MATYLMFGKYCPQGMQEMNPARTAKAVDVISQCGGSVESMYAAMGPTDLVFVLHFPTTDDAMKASVTLTKTTGIGFTTCPAITVGEFDKLIV
jgi:uncharacterized protein with GYD domain